jgi:hypothetical protein
MTRQAVVKAIKEATRFMEAAQTVLEKEDEQTFSFGNMYTAACRRASMDLTRALAEMRRR